MTLEATINQQSSKTEIVIVDPNAAEISCRIELVPYQRRFWLGAWGQKPLFIDPSHRRVVWGETTYELNEDVATKLARG